MLKKLYPTNLTISQDILRLSAFFTKPSSQVLYRNLCAFQIIPRKVIKEVDIELQIMVITVMAIKNKSDADCRDFHLYILLVDYYLSVIKELLIEINLGIPQCFHVYLFAFEYQQTLVKSIFICMCKKMLMVQILSVNGLFAKTTNAIFTLTRSQLTNKYYTSFDWHTVLRNIEHL